MSEKFERAIARFDQENSRDPNLEAVAGEWTPRELLYSRRLTEWVRKLDPNPSEILLLAARCQHICRWKIPREQFPEGRAGYHQWRNRLKEFHASMAGEILAECGYDPETIRKVQALNLKANFPKDPESRTLEDALCLVFLEFQLAAFSEKTDPDKLENALRKSWAKMTGRAREFAKRIEFSQAQRALLERIIRGEPRDQASRSNTL